METFTGSSAAEALDKVKRTLGLGAVIYKTTTRQTRTWLGRRVSLVEITAGLDRPTPQRSRYRDDSGPGVATPDPSRTAAARQLLEARRRQLADAYSTPRAPVMREVPRPPAPVGHVGGILNSPAATSAALLDFSTQFGDLKAMVKDLAQTVRITGSPKVPAELMDHYLDLVKAEVAAELATEILRDIQRDSRPEQLQQPEFVRAKMLEHLERLLPAGGPIERTKMHGPHVVALIGPTGVGKTTTVAKLAAELKLRQHRRVGLITIDTYRIAAIDQLRRYAELINIELKVVGRPEEMKAAVESMSDCDYILIDTAGRSPKDTLKLAELKRFLDLAGVDEVFLVLSSTCGAESAGLICERFGEVRIDKLIISKLDEAAQLGVVLNVVHKVNKKLAYVTTGQDVPDDIEVGHGRRLAKLILGDTGPL